MNEQTVSTREAAGVSAEVDTLTAEINVYKAQAGACIVEIGKRLLRAKEILPHGQWAEWLAEKVEFSERTAQRFMRVAESYSNPTALSDLGLTKAILLLQIPEDERDEFVAKPHMVNGEDKAVADMTTRELEKAIKERDEALRQAEAARADAEKWKNTADVRDISLKNARKKAETAQSRLEDAESSARVLRTTQAEQYQALSARYSELEGKLRAMEEAAKAEPLTAEVVPDEVTLQRIREEALREQAQAVEEANARAADAAARLEKAKNPAALRVSLWFADVQDLMVKIGHSLAELHAQQPETAFQFRDAIAAYLKDREKAFRGGDGS